MKMQGLLTSAPRTAFWILVLGVTTACGGSGDDTLPNYAVTASAGNGGSISPGSSSVQSGQTTTFTVNANEGYNIDSVTGCAGTLAGNTYTTGRITANCTVTASFTPKIFTIKATASVGGSISPSSLDVVYGSQGVFKVHADNGYAISSVSGCNGTLDQNNYKTAAITSTCSIQALFSPDLSLIPIQYSDTPTQHQTTSISLVTDADTSDVVWEVKSQPTSANLQLQASSDNKSTSFAASEPGEYEIVARSTSNGSQKSSTFLLSPVFPLDESMIEGNDGSVALDELIGVINNQAWVYSASLTEKQLRDIVTSYNGFTIVGYDATSGLLIEFNQNDIAIKESLELLKLEQGVSSVENRVYEGKNVPREELVIPDDGSNFNDAGDNWHLEAIQATSAWVYTIGNADILVGVSDSGFDINHYELKGRVSEIFTTNASDHGNGVAGSIGANTNNGKGISGINWHSQMVLTGNGYARLKSIVGKDKVVAVNNSWAIPGYLPQSFNPTSNTSVTARNKHSLATSREYRKLANANPDKLLVWSAGNGIGNGLGNSDGVFGVDGRHHSPALHYNNSGNLQKQENVVFVAAMQNDNRLVYYSNYGASVDIAAPTAYKSLKISNGYYEGNNYGDGLSGFVGTSAAAPVVTGVASLVYSLYPGFTGKEVKDILISSATEFVTERYIAPGNTGQNNSNVEVLTHPIPILNAANAIKKAQDIIDSKVTVTYAIPDPFKAQALITFNSIDKKLEPVAVDWTLEASEDGGTTWNYVNSMSVNGGVADPFLNTTTPHHRIIATITLRNPENGTEATAKKEYTFSYATITIAAVDTVTLAPLSNVEASLEQLSTTPIAASGFTDNNGRVLVYLKPDHYKVRGNLNEYQEAVTTFTVNSTQEQQVNLNMSPLSIGDVGSLSGQVVDVNGKAVVGASVRISGEAQTNGFFASAITDASGYYVISNISKADFNGKAIPAFILEASAFGYASVIKKDVIVLSGKDRVENFTLVASDLSTNIIFSDYFEQDLGEWVATGFWNRINLTNNSIANTLVDNGYTLLAPDEAGPKALLPNAFSGNYVWWYGQASTGSFIGTQRSSDSLLSGGTSTSSNRGELTSPSISLVSSQSPFLRFRTWWEIESVNPNENGYDLMEIQVSTNGGMTFQTIKKLNPYVDPNAEDRKPKPFSSGGFNRKPVWVLEEIDLSDYVGKVITLRFAFKTNDNLYNGFRGWLIDTLEIVNFSSTQTGQSINQLQRRTPKGTKDTNRAFLEIHKKPRTYSNDITPSRN